MFQVIECLQQENRINADVVANIKKYLKDNQMDTTGKLKTSGKYVHSFLLWGNFKYNLWFFSWSIKKRLITKQNKNYHEPRNLLIWENNNTSIGTILGSNKTQDEIFLFAMRNREHNWTEWRLTKLL